MADVLHAGMREGTKGSEKLKTKNAKPKLIVAPLW